MTAAGTQTTNPAKIIEEYQRAFNERDLDAWAKVLDPDIEITVDSFTLRGLDAARGYVQGIDQTYPGVVAQSERVLGIRDRVATLGGDVSVESPRGTGTTLTALIPL